MLLWNSYKTWSVLDQCLKRGFQVLQLVDNGLVGLLYLLISSMCVSNLTVDATSGNQFDLSPLKWSKSSRHVWGAQLTKGIWSVLSDSINPTKRWNICLLSNGYEETILKSLLAQHTQIGGNVKRTW
jgi:hypothetical protein